MMRISRMYEMYFRFESCRCKEAPLLAPLLCDGVGSRTPETAINSTKEGRLEFLLEWGNESSVIDIIDPKQHHKDAR